MQQLPFAVLTTEDACDAQGNRSDLLAAADLRLEPLYLDDVCKVAHHASGEVVKADCLAIAVVRRGSPSGILNRVPATEGWVERVSQGGVLGMAV
jgi:hypothetical protein